MVEYWNVGLDKEVTHFIASLSREILPIYHYSIFLEPIIPSFHYSTIPIAERSGAKFYPLFSCPQSLSSFSMPHHFLSLFFGIDDLSHLFY